MINWDQWVIIENKSEPNHAGIFLFSLKAEKKIKLDPGNQTLAISQVIPCGPEQDLNMIRKKFNEDINRM